MLIPIRFIHQNGEHVLISEHLWHKYVEVCIQSKGSGSQVWLTWGEVWKLHYPVPKARKMWITEQWISAIDSRLTALVQTILSTLLYTLLQINRPPLLPALFGLLYSLSQIKVYKLHMYIISPIQSCHLQPQGNPDVEPR